MKGWSALRYHWFKDFQLWFFITLSLFAFRLVLITSFSDQIHTDSGLNDFFTTILMGLRFDGSTAAIWVAMLFLASISTAFINWGETLHKIRTSLGQLYILVAVLIFGVDLVFFYEYGDQFNQTLFGIADDDTRAILITIWKEYHPVRFVLLATVAFLALRFLFLRWMRYSPAFCDKPSTPKARHVSSRAVIILTIFLGFVFVVRGSTLSTQPLRQHHAFASKDVFLNKTILNPFTALRYAIQKRMWMQGDEALARLWPEKDLQQALSLVTDKQQVNDIDQAIMHRVEKPNVSRPKHIFLILLESHSGWTVWPEYRDMDFSPQLSKLADEGIYFQHFIPSGTGTMPTFNALITGMPYSGLNVNYEPSALKTYPFSIADTFKRMGYRTRFFYGGYLGWQRVDNFMRAQGFDEIYGAGHIGEDKPTNEWGVDDEYLFEYIENNLDKDTPSFNLVLTTSNHPPYDLDLEKIGFSGHTLREDIKQTKDDSLTTLGHLWYSDQQTGQFVKRMVNKLDKPLFAITGDHTSRLKLKFPGQNIFEHTAVPFILYGPDVLPRTAQPGRPGSHIDILPTLYELAAPEGFEYYALGNNLLDNTITAPAIGAGYFLDAHYFYTGKSAFPLSENPEQEHHIAELNRYYRAAQAISWYRIRKGPQLP
ncbi:MAG: sulfatase-like hydrolase/transferase [Thioalkalispiraceae bacterium]|jgi:phosphoglycerol transferase MdoB-like AlkP superfamily enzyme